MLTIIHDTLFVAGKRVETATAEGVEVMLPRRASCKLAAVLIENGFERDTPVRLVRADPYLFGPPHSIENISLSTAASVDFFGEAETPTVGSQARRGRPVGIRHKL